MAMSWWSSAQSMPQNTSMIVAPPVVVCFVLALSRAGHARSLMEGLQGTAIRLAVRDPSGPQGPGPGWSSNAPVSVRGPSCGWQRPRPPIPVPAPRLRVPGRRVAHGQRGSGGRRRAARISTEGSTPRCRLRVTRHQPPPPRSPDPFGLRRGLSRASGTEGMHGSGRQAPRSTEGASGPGAGRRWLAMCPLGAGGRGVFGGGNPQA
jgi:hypothetical protein